MAIDYVWRRGDAAGWNILLTGATEGGALRGGVVVTPQPLSRVVRVVAGFGASYHQQQRYSSEWIGAPVVWQCSVTIYNSAAPVGFPKTVNEQVGAAAAAMVQVVPWPTPSPAPLPDMHTTWSMRADTVDARRSDFSRGVDVEGAPQYNLAWRVDGIPTDTDPTRFPVRASWRGFLKLLCEVGEPAN